MLGVCADVVLFLVPVWIAFLLGVLVGWVWKPKWASLGRVELSCSVLGQSDSSFPFLPPKSVMSPLKGFGSDPCLTSFKVQWPSFNFRNLDAAAAAKKKPISQSPALFEDCSTSEAGEISTLLSEEDLTQLWHLVEMKDGGPSWTHMMDRYTLSMSYQAWRRDPKTGPPQYRSRTIFEDATPETVRDFFWDDDFRSKWDDMLAYSTTVEDCPSTGTMVVHWIRKFPFFCSDREYIIGRRIWEYERSYFCVTKGVHYPSIPRRNKPRRVDLYYSSWCIRAVESRKNDGQLTACEVLLFHYEDMGIPNEIAKLGIRQGMWGAVKKIEPGLHAYQKARASGAPLSHPAKMAEINTKISPEFVKSLEESDDTSEAGKANVVEKPKGGNLPKVLFIGGILVLAFSLNHGLLTKAAIFSVTQKFGNLRRRRPEEKH
ncbi:hypothetical protein BT93_K2130 [Corymbia citriodora subsp. variegata]|nr:hypothetical protein BT93_K2130 [Corymbia citriodora subsp. variegata]